ncbi:MAG: PAS domain S-box protein, partial [Nitrospinota bacterium]|nr:PAS domain S-box protein [Nitrospinota bacterium]
VFVLLMMLRGAVWGGGAYYFFPPGDIAGQAFLFLLILALCAQTISAHPGLWSANLSFSFLALLPMTSKCVTPGDIHGIAMAAAAWALFLILLYSARGLGTDEAPPPAEEKEAPMFKKLMDQAGESIFIIDAQTSMFVDVNESACRNLGYTKEELCSMSVKDVEMRVSQDKNWDTTIEDIKNNRNRNLPGIHRRKDGSQFPVEVNTNHISEGDSEYIVAFARDVSEREAIMRKLADSEKELTTILESIPLSIMILGQDGLVKYFNLASSDWYGISAAEAQDKPEPDIWATPEDREEFYSMLEKRGYVGSFEAAHKMAGEAEQWVMVSGVKIILNEGPVLLVTRREITDLKNTENGLKAAKLRAEAATELKDQFVSLVSHDLRSPLGSIQGLTRLLRGQWSDRGEKGPEIIEKVIKATDMMVTMVDQLLDISRLQTGKIIPQIESFSASNFVDDLMENIDFLAREKEVALVNELPQDMFVSADRGLLVEVIRNLLSNAVKFCAEGNRVVVYNPEGRPGVLAVKDDGVGMDEFALENVFKHEVKTTSEGTAGEKGTGLGLPYCHDIMKAHGGDLTVESEEGKGTVFYVVLPKEGEGGEALTKD